MNRNKTDAAKIYFVLYIIILAEVLLVMIDRDAAEDTMKSYYLDDVGRYELSFVDDIDTVTWINNTKFTSQHELVTKGFLSDEEKTGIKMRVKIQDIDAIKQDPKTLKIDTVTIMLQEGEEKIIGGMRFKLKKVMANSSLNNKILSANYILRGKPTTGANNQFLCTACFTLKERKLPDNLAESVNEIVRKALISKKIISNVKSKEYSFRLNIVGGSIVD